MDLGFLQGMGVRTDLITGGMEGSLLRRRFLSSSRKGGRLRDELKERVRSRLDAGEWAGVVKTYHQQ